MKQKLAQEQNVSPENRRRKLAPLGLMFAVVGLILFAYFVSKAGPSQIIAGISRLGAGFFLILAIAAMRHMVRSLAWTQCFEAPYRLRFRDAFAARLMGDALGNIIPVASIAVGEPSKAAFVRHRVPLMAAVSALALENIFYSLSVIIFIFCGTTALLLSFPLPRPLRYASFGALIGTSLVAIVGYVAIRMRWRFVSGPLRMFAKLGLAPSWISKIEPRVQIVEDTIYGFYQRHSSGLLFIFGLECCFHVAGVIEIYTTLSFISDIGPPTILAAFILESVNRIINIAFKFVPLRTGVDEAGTGMLSKVLGFTTAIGVTLAIVRKGRDIFWATIGVILMVRRGLSLRGIDREARP